MKFYKIIYTCNRRRVLSASLSFTAQGRLIAWCKFVSRKGPVPYSGPRPYSGPQRDFFAPFLDRLFYHTVVHYNGPVPYSGPRSYNGPRIMK